MLTKLGQEMTSNPAFTEGNIQKANALACLASVFNRVIARKLEREQNKWKGKGKGEAFPSLLPPPPPFLFVLLFSQLSGRTRAETLATQATNAYLLDSRPEQKSVVTYHTLPSLYMCVWLVNTSTSTAPIGSPIICM